MLAKAVHRGLGGADTSLIAIWEGASARTIVTQ